MSQRHRLILIAILALSLLLNAFYATQTPLFETPDEMWHYALVRELATNGLVLPVQDAANPGPWMQEGGQPPLYYFLAALATSHIDTSDFEQARQVNPHADVGLIRGDGNVNLVMHDPAREALPWTGTVLAMHVARLFSALLGTLTVFTTYLLAREVFPQWPGVALGAAALNAVLPMFVFISGAVNNDNLSNLLAGLLLWQLARLLDRTQAPGVGTYIAFGLTAGAALLAKLSLGFMLPLVALGLLIVSWRARDWRPVMIGGLISGGLTILIAGWWYARNAQLYGDPTGLNVFVQIIGARAVPADLVQLWSERDSFLRSWWGLFGSMNVPLPEAYYTLLNIVGGLALLGFVAFLVAWALKRLPEDRRARGLLLALILAWPLLAFVALLRWTSVTWASQGRLMFIAIGPVSLWLAVGLMWFLGQKRRDTLVGSWTGYLLGTALLAITTVIRPAYAPPQMLAAVPGDVLAASGENDAVYEPGAADPTLYVLDAAVPVAAIQPGDDLPLVPIWNFTQPPTRRWSLFVHVIDSAGVIVAQRDRYPGNGLIATDWLIGNEAWNEWVIVPIPDGVYTPDELTIAVGLYDYTTGERMTLADGSDRLILDETVRLEPADPDSEFPNPRADNFADLMTLQGYELSARRLQPGDDLTVTLYWQGQQTMSTDYTVFVHVIDLSTWTIYAGSDAYPAAWSAPTSTWTPGKTIIDVHTLRLDPATPPGVYQIEVGVYSMPEEGVFERLHTVAPYG
ncbi:MAG: glycosyltransferase family 39 protein, partial [Anaerolineae bacterium]|nr:glycosyltransferase family 39 protein [Anaerolineae bacterium]